MTRRLILSSSFPSPSSDVEWAASVASQNRPRRGNAIFFVDEVQWDVATVAERSIVAGSCPGRLNEIQRRPSRISGGIDGNQQLTLDVIP